MHALATAFADLMMRGQQPIHRANRAVMAILIQQRGKYCRRGHDKLTYTHQGEVVSHKRLGAMLTLIGEKQKSCRKKSAASNAPLVATLPRLPWLEPWPTSSRRDNSRTVACACWGVVSRAMAQRAH
jgi:hypothetical protein